jgi:tetratricopeptide (TPR) repeat protein
MWTLTARLLFVPALLACLQACDSSQDARVEAAHLAEARQAWLAGDFNEAEAGYQAYLQRFPDGPGRVESWKRLADIAYVVRGQPAKAVTLLETALLEKKLDETSFLELSSMAIEASQRARQNDKTVFFSRNVLEQPNIPPSASLPVFLSLAQAQLGLGDVQSALDTLRECRQKIQVPALSAPCSFQLAKLVSPTDSGVAQTIFLSLYNDVTVDTILRAQAGFALGEAAEMRHNSALAKFWYEAIQNTYPNPKVIVNKLQLLLK